jgi:hypothetical protein
MMMSDYAQGFKDGFAAGLAEGKKLVEEQWRLHTITELEKTLPKPQPRLDDYVFGARETCPKCHVRVDRAMGYVCASPNCPTFPKITCGVPMTGAIGSAISQTYAAGANGPAGPFDGPEYANRAWINGEWVELGS